jgi:hypothetical protein
VLEAAGFKDVHTEIAPMKFPVSIPNGVCDHMFRSGNPAMEAMLSPFKAAGGDLVAAEKEFTKILMADYPEGVRADATLGWGRK